MISNAFGAITTSKPYLVISGQFKRLKLNLVNSHVDKERPLTLINNPLTVSVMFHFESL